MAPYTHVEFKVLRKTVDSFCEPPTRVLPSASLEQVCMVAPRRSSLPILRLFLRELGVKW